MLAALDYGKVKCTMKEGGHSTPALLQALRWRLTKPARRLRKTALAQYIRNDVLGGSVLSALLSSCAAPAVREQAHRLINIFASDASGRSYLLSQEGLIERLCKLLQSETMDTVARQNCLGALQKLSLQRRPQNTMIDNGVIAWLVTQLSDIDALSQYAVEYGTALLMNLSLRSAGRSKCVEPELDVLTVLSQLMESDSMQVRTYVNGTLYSVLVRAPLKARAAEIGLPDSLQELIKHSDETFARQINYILEQIDKEPTSEEEDAANEAADDSAEEEEEVDEEEVDDDEVDVFAESPLSLEPYDDVAGEALLAAQFLQQDLHEAQEDATQLDATMRDQEERRAAAAAASAQMQRPNDPSARRRHHPDEPLQRPTTPHINVDYSVQALQQAEAMGQQGSYDDEIVHRLANEELPYEDALLGQGEDGGDDLIPESVSYPDPDAIDASSPTIPVRNRLSRTPHKKMRDTNLLPVQPTASRPRATVERLQRRPPNQPHGHHTVGSPGTGK